MSIEGKLLEEINEGIKETNDLLRALLEAIEQGIPAKRAPRKGVSSSLSQSDKEDLEESMRTLDEWWESFGEEPRPAKYVNSMGIGPEVAYLKPEMDWIFNRLLEIVSVEPKNAAGTHVFKYLGKTYCKPEKNTVNCFAFVPVGVTR